MATSRNRSYHACTARRRSTRSGRARATSSAWTCCALSREPDSLEALLAELNRARGADLRLDGRLVRLSNALADQNALEPRARQLVEQLALALQASVLVQHAPAAVADAFCVSRLSDNPGRQFGLPNGFDLGAICAGHAGARM